MTEKIDIVDLKERDRALNPAESFIVQAPAGSGKTELLTQRFLVLLAEVKEPEEILAITFTKKSAAEMRHRISNALYDAHTTPEPLADHAKKTWRLAKNALQRNDTFKWNLLDNPNRLQIITIDSFNASLTRQLPLLSNFGAPLEINDKPEYLYREAVRELLTYLEANDSWSDAIALLLLHLDNNVSACEELLISMLLKRDQWLPYLASADGAHLLRETLETNFKKIQLEALEKIQTLISSAEMNELIELSRYAANNLRTEQRPSTLTSCLDLTAPPSLDAKGVLVWQSFAALLLTEKETWRKSFDVRIGFPSDKKNTVMTAYKQRIVDLLRQLNENEPLRYALIQIKSLPDECYSDSQWQVLNALYQVLKIAVAQLNVIFQQHGQIDYIENAQAALHALGTEENPTDLALALDYRIQHILVDEFQDTSSNQYRLLEKLIHGWQSGDGRTLFVVGDPMQSIYRFREAEVGLFIRARQKGIHHLPLTPLTLSVNFRSSSAIVEWVNTHFSKIFPAEENISKGAVTYSHSRAYASTATEEKAVTLHPLTDANEEAKKIVALIQQRKKEDPKGTIAILVRSRNHLEDIVPALQEANLSYRAIAIDPLEKRPLIQDLMALTSALFYPEDRIAWLSVLRAPWCGLSLSDLLLIAKEKNRILWDSLHNTHVSDEGQKRLKRIIPVLQIALTQRQRLSARAFVETTWMDLGGPATFFNLTDIDDARAFFELLEKMDDNTGLLDANVLRDNVKKLYSSPNTESDDTLQIMTIHNAKGLEFDSVILPKLNSKTTQDDHLLLEWLEQTNPDESSALLLAPIKAIGKESDNIYNYIRSQRLAKTDLESTRLLYVAVTRAKKKLDLFFTLDNTKSGSLLSKLWPAISHQFEEAEEKPEIELTDIPVKRAPRPITRLPLHWKNPYVSSDLTLQLTPFENKPGFQLKDTTLRHLGTTLHKIFQQIAEHSPSWWNDAAQHQDAYIHSLLMQSGFLQHALSDATLLIKKAVQTFLTDTRGQWIIHSHQHAANELPLTAVINGDIKHMIIDRTFVDENKIRWIIDYKTTQYTGDDLEGFLSIEKNIYEKQLREYYEALKHIDDKPICAGLYFPLIPAWVEWTFT